MKKHIPYDQDMTGIAQTLRKTATPEEGKLWQLYLKKYPIQFRRQKPLGRYVLDFYCGQAKLAVELDGSQHFSPEGMAADQNRTAYLESVGIQVIRFTNEDVNKHLYDVCHAIDAAVKARINTASNAGN